MPSDQSLFPLHDYLLDAWQRSILFLDVLRRRGNIYHEHNARAAPNVLTFDVEPVLDGRSLVRPVNYLLVRVLPSDGSEAEPGKRPFVVVDPRAGHGPGIGGMKQDSELGVALAAGHPSYFIGFLPEPVPGQTIHDVCGAQAAFIEKVASLHPDADGKPAVIANCQAGWQTMMMAATHPDVAGPIMLAGSPLSYWAGVHGKNPLRYLGGILGGTWLTTFAGDVGHGTFDGANLVANFELLDPAHTYWAKPYNVYSKVDTEAERFLDFETWWDSPVLLNSGEMQWIADNLFVGNKLSSGELSTPEGVRIDLRNIASPIIVFCSWGDNITPPQQALGWVTDLYENDAELIANGQTIVYCLHHSVGHLGIFVSGKIATKEHGEFTGCMDLIDLMPPGLYEAVITEVNDDTANPALIEGRYLFALEARSLADIRALGENSAEDNLRFATAARVSELNRRLYERFVHPGVQAVASETSAEALRRTHPNRLRFATFSDENPAMKLVSETAETVRQSRKPVAADNPFLAMERTASTWIEYSLDLLGKARDATIETLFLQTYGSPLLQALVGADPGTSEPGRRIERDPLREAEQSQRRVALEQQFESGGTAAVLVRALAYVRAADGTIDERGLAMIKALRDSQPSARRRTMGELKALLRDQTMLLRLDEDRALEAIPRLLPRNHDERGTVLDGLRRVINARGELSEEATRRLARIEALFDGKSEKRARKETSDA